MIKTENLADGSRRDSFKLKGLLDGCQLEVIQLPDGELVVHLQDEQSGDNLVGMNLKLGRKVVIKDGKEEVKTLVRVVSQPEARAKELVLDEETKELRESEVEWKAVILKLTSWWLTQRGYSVVLEEKGEMLTRTEADWVAKTRLEALMAGEAVDLKQGLWAQISCSRTKDGHWILEAAMDNHETYVAWVAAALYVYADGQRRLFISDMISDWPKEDLKLDVLSLARFYLDKRVGELEDLEMMYQEKPLEFDDEEIRKRCDYWLDLGDD